MGSACELVASDGQFVGGIVSVFVVSTRPLSRVVLVLVMLLMLVVLLMLLMLLVLLVLLVLL